MRIYFLGICGTAMGNAALLLRGAGHDILGSDSGVYPPMSDVLAAAGIPVLEGFDADRLAKAVPDLVVVGNAVSRGNPELEWLLAEKKTAFTSLPALLHDHLLRGRQNIVVAGTHGKTTTTTLAALLIKANGRDPGYLIGGVPLDLPGGARAGGLGEPFVIEGDEYDSALFDKRSKFIHYAPHVAVINNIEFDHADIFRDEADVCRAFDHFVRIVPDNGYILVNADDPRAVEIGKVSWATVYSVGTQDGADLVIRRFVENSEGVSFDLEWRGKVWASVRWDVWCLCNARNAAMAALAAGLTIFPDDITRLDLSALARFQGVKRRQEILFDSSAITVMEDFGHHPTAVHAMLVSLRNRYPESEINAVFEPRSNTSRRRVHQEALTTALALADFACLGPIDRPEKIDPRERLDTGAVVTRLRGSGVEAESAGSHAEVWEVLQKRLSQATDRHRLVVIFTNGSFGGIMSRLAEELKLANEPGNKPAPAAH